MTWERWQPTAEQPWDIRRIVHLHRRAGFGANWTLIQRDLREGPDAAIERVLTGLDRESRIDSVMDGLGNAAVGANRPERLKAWWLLRIVKSPSPLREKLTLMWHNHFATSNEKVRSLAAMKRQNEQLHTYAAGRFGDLFTAIVKDPAMLVWLDAPSNKKGRPNENLAREIMELFSLGIGNYSEKDVREAARALTGWGISNDGEFRFTERHHDHGMKTILGQIGPWNGYDLLRILIMQPAVSERIAWRLCKTFMGEGVVTDDLFLVLSKHLRKHDLHIGNAVATMIRSRLFFSDKNIGSRISSPVEFVTSAVRSLDCTRPSTVKLAEWTRELGQDLFYPPNVGGWTGGRNWLSSRNIIGRANFASALSEGKLDKIQPMGGGLPGPDFAELVKRQSAGKVNLDVAVPLLCELLLGFRLPSEQNEKLIESLREHPEGLDRQLKLAVSLILSLPQAQQS